MLSLFKVFMDPSSADEVSKVLLSGSITQGPKVEEFEQSLQKWFNYPYILTLNSATSGLTLALRLLNPSKGDEILSSPLTCTATNWPILANGLDIKWVDVDPDTCNINLDDLKAKITERTKIVIFVHWGGSPVNLSKVEEIKSYTKEKFGHELLVIEDCAHSFGAEYKGKKIGTHGNICVFSLQAIKHLTTGDGGLIFLPNKELYDRAKLLRWYGIRREQRSGGGDFRLENDVKEWGYKFHMNDINATIGLSNLPHIEKNLQVVRDNIDYYQKELESIKGVTLLKETQDSMSAYWIYTIKIIGKKEFIEFMKTKNVMTSQVHNRNDTHSCVEKFKSKLPILDELEKEIVCIPCGWWITKSDREYVIKCIREWCTTRLADYIFREIDIGDYYKGFLEVLEQMNNYKQDIPYEKFCIQVDDIKKSGGFLYVIEHDNKIVGTAKLLIESKIYQSVGHLEDCVTDKNHRRKGLFYKLEKVLIDLAKTKNCYKIICQSRVHVKNIHEKSGFTINDENNYVLYLNSQ